MFDYVCVFTTGGVLLWQNQLFADFKLEVINMFIKACLLENQTVSQGQNRKFNYQEYDLKWTIHSEFKLVFAVAYKEILQLAFVEQFLDMFQKAFAGIAVPKITRQGDLWVVPPEVQGNDIFMPQYQVIYSKWDDIVKQQLQAPKKMRTFNETQKGKKNGKKGKNPSANNQVEESKDTIDSTSNPNNNNNSGGSGEDTPNSSASPDAIQANRDKLKKRFNTTGGVKKSSSNSQLVSPEKLKDPETSDPAPTNFSTRNEIKPRQWHTVSTKVDKKTMDKFDMSVQKDDKVNLEAEMEKYLGGDDDILQGFLESDDEPVFETLENGQQETKSLFSRISSAFGNVTGNKEMTREEIDPLLKQFAQQLMDKNVAQDVSQQICQKVEQSLLNQRTQTFTSVRSTIKQVLSNTITELLTPKRHIDILQQALSAKKQGRLFSVAFIGVNGVGKSTSLAKVAYYLRSKGGLKVMLAACDNFRSGAIEQLATHAACLDVPMYERGYGDDPSIIAKEALQEARNKKYDVVLIDTAGRMQGNEKLMKQLAKLVHINSPDVVLFVGEALVGNDAIDQLTKFNQSLIDYAVNSSQPRVIDGIVLTKFDTVDEKVGTALNMVQTTGKPIVFVGVGQKYPHLKKLNVPTVINALMN